LMPDIRVPGWHVVDYSHIKVLAYEQRLSVE
jgi:hypothetical protein